MNENQSVVRRIKIDDDLVDEGEARGPFNFLRLLSILFDI